MKALGIAMFLLVCVASACKSSKSNASKSEDRPDPTREQLLEEQRRIERGEVVGEALRAPRIVVDANQIAINGHRVAARSDLPKADLQRIETVYEWSKGLREHWKQIHPGQQLESAADVTLPTDLSFFEGASLVVTLAFSGFPDGMTVHAGAENVTLTVYVPGPPDPTDVSSKKILEICHAEGWNARYGYSFARTETSPAPWGRDPGTPRATPETPWTALTGTKSPWRAVSRPDAANVVGELCPERCDRAIVGSESASVTWIDALAMTAAALGAKGHERLPISFSKCGKAEPDAGAPVAVVPSGKPPKLRMGAMSVKGGLATEVVERIINQQMAGFRQCYQKGSGQNPMLTGRVATTFTIDENGLVAKAENAGSDMPDVGVVTCVNGLFKQMTFPKPDKGTVTVMCPLLFAPDE